MTKAVTLANLASGEALTIDETNDRIGIASTAPSASVDVNQTILLDGNSGVVTATSFSGDGSSLTGVANTNFVVGTALTMVSVNVSGSATISGQLSVGGTINYEDVTNVDSVGVVTARIGLKVLAGGINAVGVVTATSFSGTVPSSSLSGALPALDGSALTGIAATDNINTNNIKVSGITTLGTTTTVGNVTIGIGKSINFGNTQKAFIQGHSVGVGTTTTTGRNAGLGTAIGTIIFNSSALSLQLYNGDEWEKITGDPITATGGSASPTSRSGFVVHTFTGSGSFQVTAGRGDVEYVIYGGGGGGAGHAGGGGGGAGGVRSGTIPLLGPGTYTVTVGNGGPGGPTSSGHVATSGGDSSIAFPTGKGGTIIGYGGGGGRDGTNSGGDGGSGGGGSGVADPGQGAYGYNPGTPSPLLNPALQPLHPYPLTQGNNGGGTQQSPGYKGGGGGGTGAGADPTNAINVLAPNGGAGTPFSITGSSVTKGGGGGGGAHGPGASGGEGGSGGGADGSPAGPNTKAPSASANTASGGGGGGGQSGVNPSSGGDGGSGIIYVAYPST